jgi:DNA invertase Pin-like site-specific DNA recombinase
MKIGYARVSTDDQNLSLQYDALKNAGCEKIYEDRLSGAAAVRAGLTALLQTVRTGDVIVVWRLDRLGRSLKDLIELVTMLEETGAGLSSVQEKIDTTSSGGRLVFHIFGALAEFERNLIRERTQAGLVAARARGRTGGRPRALSDKKQELLFKLYDSKEHSIADICHTLNVSKPTIYTYLQTRSKLPAKQLPALPAQPIEKKITVDFSMYVENGSKFTRGKKRAYESIERFHLQQYKMKKLRDGKYELTFSYQDNKHLNKQIYDLLQEAANEADMHNCFIETTVKEKGTNRYW